MAPTRVAKSMSFPASPEQTATGDVAADAFARFDRAVPPDEVVTELALPVDTVEYLWRTWARLRGVVPLSPEAGRALREALYGNLPIASGAHAVAAVRSFLERPLKPCPRCKEGAREYCATCTSKEAKRAARGTLRGSTKTRLYQNNRPRVPRGLEVPAAREGNTSFDAITDDEPTGLTEVPCPEPGEQSP